MKAKILYTLRILGRFTLYIFLICSLFGLIVLSSTELEKTPWSIWTIVPILIMYFLDVYCGILIYSVAYFGIIKGLKDKKGGIHGI